MVTDRLASDPIPPFVLFGMTAVTGIVDAVSFLALGYVFTANMTGNVVFLGFAASAAAGVSIVRSAFQMTSHPAHHRASRAFALDAALPNSAGENTAPLFAVIALTAIAMGLRNATVRRLAIADLTTTVPRLTITGLAADSSPPYSACLRGLLQATSC